MAPIAVVSPVFGNAATLAPLAARLAVALSEYDWRLHLVVDGSPDDSLEVARRLAAAEPRIAITAFERNAGQPQAVRCGLAAEATASVWVCIDADLQDPPEAVPLLLRRLAVGDVAAVFAGRRGAYEPMGRLVTGRLYRSALSVLTGLPRDAGGFMAVSAAVRQAILDLNAPSIVAAIGASGLPSTSVPVVRSPRTSGRSQWTRRARVRHSAGTLSWLVRNRRALPLPQGDADGVQRWTITSA